jgi:hypothetical protein
MKKNINRGEGQPPLSLSEGSGDSGDCPPVVVGAQQGHAAAWPYTGRMKAAPSFHRELMRCPLRFEHTRLSLGFVGRAFYEPVRRCSESA